MTDTATETRSVVVERDLPFPPAKIWRAMTTPHLLAEWLMQNDFQLSQDHRFQFRGDWGAADCKILAIEPERKLIFSWDAMGMPTVVTWTLTATATGAHLRMEQAGFSTNYPQAISGATWGWTKFLGNLEQLLAKE